MKSLLLPLLLAAALPCAPAAPVEPTELAPSTATEQWKPVPTVISCPPGQPPSDAIVLFDGKSLDAWTPVNPGSKGWTITDGVMVVVPNAGYVATKRAFGDIQLHLEYREPALVKGSGQLRGNSGIFFMGQYELQIVDSYNNPTYVNGQAGAAYKQYAPLVNACRPPGEWQTYDAIFVAPRFTAAGGLYSPARLTVIHNGALVQLDVPLLGATFNRGYAHYTPHAAKLPILLQEHHGDLVAFRNIWVREITLPQPAN